MNSWSVLENICFCQSILMTSILIIIFILPGVSAVVCKVDHYFDPNTGNCDPCAPLCAVTNCSRICPYYYVPRASSIVQTSLSDNSLTFRIEHVVIIVAMIAFALALFGYISYKRHQRKRSEIPVTTVAVQIDDSDTENEERVTINTNTEHCSRF